MRSSARGFTVSELLVAMTLGLLVTGLALNSSISNKNAWGKDVVRTRLNQNIRGSLDIIGVDARVAGENLNSSFPAVEVIDGGAGSPDTLVIRRNLLEEVLPLCTTITAGTSTTDIFFATGGSTAGCVYSGQTHNYTTWRSYRLAQPASQVRAYLHNSTTRQGEFFDYVSESSSSPDYSLSRSPGTWANTYTAGASAIYILEEWQYQIQNGLLQVVQNRETGNPLNVAFDIADFQVTILLNDDSVLNSFAATENWTDIAALQVAITGIGSFRGAPVTRTVSGSFFPRNILSN